MTAVTVEALLSPPCPRVGVTITDLGVSESIITVWRTADGERNPVRGARRISATDATFITDYDAPLGRPITYEVEVLSGPAGASRTTSEPVSVDSETGWIMDPLVPQTAVPVVGGEGDELYLRPAALAELEYRANIQIYEIMGQSKPMALFGQRQAETGLDTSIGAASAEQNARLKVLLLSTAQLLFRPLPSWGKFELPGTMFIANPVAKQLPVDVAWGGELTWWDLKSDVVQAPTVKVLTATFTYGDVGILFPTYQHKLDSVLAAAAAAGMAPTYLFDMKYPIGG